MRKYMKKKYKWSRSVLDSVHWASIGAVRRKLSNSKKRQTCKIMHGWLPTMHMRSHITRINQCPGCTCRDETIDHLFHCPHPRIQRAKKDILAQLRKKGLKAKIHKSILKAFIRVFRCYFDEESDQTTLCFQTRETGHRDDRQLQSCKRLKSKQQSPSNMPSVFT